MKGKVKKTVAIVLALLLAALTPLTSSAATNTVINNSGGVVYAKSAKKVFKGVTSGKNYKYVKWCNARGMYDDDSNRSNPNKIIDKDKAIEYVFNLYYGPIEFAHMNGYSFYGDSYINNSYSTNIRYDSTGKAYYYESSTGRYRASDGTYWDTVNNNIYYYDNYSYYYNNYYDSIYNNRSRSSSRFSTKSIAWDWALSIGIINPSDHMGDTAKMTWYYDVLDALAWYIDGGGADWSRLKSGKMSKLDASRILYLFGTMSRSVYDPDNIGRITNSYNRNYYYTPSYYY